MIENEVPIGRYADWIESRCSYAYFFEKLTFGRPKIQLSLSLNHVGSKGAQQIHRWVHKVSGNNIYEDTSYINQPEGFFINRGIHLAWIFNPKKLN